MTTNITKEEWLATLVGMDTTSRNSNMGLIETIRDALSTQGVDSWLTTDDKGAKANLLPPCRLQTGRPRAALRYRDTPTWCRWTGRTGTAILLCCCPRKIASMVAAPAI